MSFELGVILAGTNIVSFLHSGDGAIARARHANLARLSRDHAEGSVADG